MEAASLGKHVLWVRYWVISSSEESGGKREAGGRRGIPPHTNIDAYTNTTYITTLCHVTLYTNIHNNIYNTHGFWGGCSYSGSPASSIVTARQVYRVLWACPDAVCSVDTTLPYYQQHQAGSCSQCGVCRFVYGVCNYVMCMCLHACTCICVVVGMWVCVMRV